MLAATVVLSSERANVDSTDGQPDGLEHRLFALVTVGPWDLDIAAAMSACGYDEVQWMEGQGMLAELIATESAAPQVVAAVTEWYEEAAGAARQALAAHPNLLARLRLGDVGQTCS